MLLSMSIGISSVMLLTALGEGARRYVIDQFGSMGTNILIVLPGRFETVGSGPETQFRHPKCCSYRFGDRPGLLERAGTGSCGSGFYAVIVSGP
jgi:hypothetical protein